MSLPTIKAITEAVNDEAACKALLLQTLSYGTDYDSWLKKDDLDKRSEKATNVLVQAWSSTLALQPNLVDSLWLVASLCSEPNDALIHIIKALVEQVPDRQDFWVALQATLDPALLEAVQLLPTGGKEVMLKKVRKINTETHYRQHKFNLLQEESEGYAKLLALIMASPLASDVSTRIRDCIGTFELDPNRVLDLLLDLLEAHMPTGSEKPSRTDEIEQILALLQEFSVDKIPHLLGFKLRSSNPVSHRLYATVAFLATQEVLDLATLLPHLPPLDDINNAYKLFEKCERQRIQAMGRIRLNADNANKEDPKLTKDLAQLRETTTVLEKNALIGLVKVLLQWKEWSLAKMVLRGSCTKVCTLLPNSIGKVLSDFVSEQIQGVYRANVPMPELLTVLSPPPSSDDMIPESASLQQVLDAILEPVQGIMESAFIASNPILYSQLCRLMKALLEKETSLDSLSSAAYSMLKMLVSSLSLFSPNPAIAADVWSLLSILPYPTRYCLYRDWRGCGLERAGVSTKPLFHVQSEMEAGKAARYSLKRLAKDNLRDMGRQVSKVTHSNPLVVFSTILSQVESYDNLIEMMVEAVRFVTPLGLDVLGFCILSRLDGTSESGNRNRMKGDGVNVSQWLSSLESFTGAFYKKCSHVEFRGIIRFVIGRLKDGHVQELGILRTLLKTVGGYSFADFSPVASLATTQLEGRSGSQLLKRETFAFGVVEQTNWRASRMLRSVLQEDDMGVMIVVLLAQIRSRIIFDTSGRRPKPVKLIGNLYDSVQVVLSMLVEFLTDSTDEAMENGERTGSSSAIKRYADSLPSLGDLREKYGLDTESAWMVCRPVSRAAVVVEGAEKNGKGKKKNGSEEEAVVQSYLPSGEAMTDVYGAMLPEKAWESITMALFELFFSHSLYDISCPEDQYKAEMARLKKEIERLVQKQKGNPGSLMPGPPFTMTDEMELERVRRASTILASDMSLQKKRHEKLQLGFQSRKADCFASETVSTSSIQTFLMHCIYPRCVSTPDDALYCAQFVSLLHRNDTPGFSTMIFIDELVDVMAGALYCATEDEAANMAIMLLETWKMVSKWRYDDEAFDAEVAGKPGSEFLFDGEVVSVSKEQYELLYNKWHAKLGAMFLGSLKSTEYMVARACLLVLSRIVDAFPTRPGLGQRLLEALKPFEEESYPLQDIKTAAQAYGMLLLKARDDGVWKEEDAAAAEARAEQEKAALKQRQKKAEEQFEEMKLENEKITEEMGDGRGRDDRRRAPPRGVVQPRGRDDRRPPMNPGAPAFEPARRSTRSAPEMEENGSRHRRDDGRTRERDDYGGRSGEMSRRSTRPSDTRRGDEGRVGAGGRETSRRGGGRDNEPAGLDGRWERSAPAQSSRTKRARSPDDDGRATKRGRTDRDGDGVRSRPPSSDGMERRDGGRAGGRNLSPSRRGQREPRSPPRRSERRR